LSGCASSSIQHAARSPPLVQRLLGDSSQLTTTASHVPSRRHSVPRFTHAAAGQLRLSDAHERRPVNELDALLGRPRALVLRHLDRPATVGSIAAALYAVPSAASYHITALAAAGLVARERRGQYVLVHRTAKGTALLALYES
jgi:DNA-binding transcriptional ArsR family regulator